MILSLVEFGFDWICSFEVIRVTSKLSMGCLFEFEILVFYID